MRDAWSWIGKPEHISARTLVENLLLFYSGDFDFPSDLGHWRIMQIQYYSAPE